MRSSDRMKLVFIAHLLAFMQQHDHVHHPNETANALAVVPFQVARQKVMSNLKLTEAGDNYPSHFCINHG